MRNPEPGTGAASWWAGWHCGWDRVGRYSLPWRAGFVVSEGRLVARELYLLLEDCEDD